MYFLFYPISQAISNRPWSPFLFLIFLLKISLCSMEIKNASQNAKILFNKWKFCKRSRRKPPLHKLIKNYSIGIKQFWFYKYKMPYRPPSLPTSKRSLPTRRGGVWLVEHHYEPKERYRPGEWLVDKPSFLPAAHWKVNINCEKIATDHEGGGSVDKPYYD